jgi:hypothetical protein
MASRTMNYAFVDKNWHESSIVVARCKEVYLVYNGSPDFSLLVFMALCWKCISCLQIIAVNKFKL